MVTQTATVSVAKAIRLALVANASSRTTRYFVGNEETEAGKMLRKSFNDKLDKVAETLEAIRSTDASSITTDDGDSYLVSEYHFPSVLLDYVNSGRIYASIDAIGKADPCFRIERKVAKLSPLQFNKFFDDFNTNQLEDYKVKLVESWSRTPCTLEEIQFLKDESGVMLKLHEAGFDIYTCDLIGIMIPGSSEYLTSYNAPTEKGYESWLLK